LFLNWVSKDIGYSIFGFFSFLYWSVLISLQSKVMAVAVFGGAVLGAAFGEVFAVLHDTVKNVGSKALVFKSELKSLKSTLDLLAPVVKEISQSNRDVGRSEEETKSLIEDMKKAEELIRTCSAISGWTIIFQAHHSKQLTELNKDIVKFCQVQMPAQTKRDTSQILRYTQSLEDKSSQILGNTSQISQILEDTSSQILGNTSQILGNTSQISHILEDKSSQILGNTSQISQILEDTSSQILGNTSQILGNTSQISQILEDKSSQISQILEDTSSQILGNTSQISQILEDKSSQILGNTSQILDVLITGI
jgi:hypothetical protein